MGAQAAGVAELAVPTSNVGTWGGHGRHAEVLESPVASRQARSLSPLHLPPRAPAGWGRPGLLGQSCRQRGPCGLPPSLRPSSPAPAPAHRPGNCLLLREPASHTGSRKLAAVSAARFISAGESEA